jgi:hypothetical protein
MTDSGRNRIECARCTMHACIRSSVAENMHRAAASHRPVGAVGRFFPKHSFDRVAPEVPTHFMCHPSLLYFRSQGVPCSSLRNDLMDCCRAQC